MLPEPTTTVRELAIAIPNATRVFERIRIDYCCGGNQPLNEACAQAGLDVEEVIQLLSQAGSTDVGSESTNLQSLALAQLAEYIVNKHHVYTREELERLTELLKKVCSVHGANHPELLKIETQFQALKFELEPHILKEERILFPYITRLETAALENTPAPFAPFGTVQNPINAMMREHDAAGEIMKAIRQLSGDFALPEDACFSFRTLYTVLQELESDLHQHIHLENNVLFPRALEIENKLQPATA
jgi:regulator of cell morphogenesis and NO signaling